MDARTLAALVVQCRNGDRGAWDALVEQYWQRLYSYAMQATRSNDLATDLVQETFLRVVQKLDRYEDQGKFEAWLFRILVNLVRDKSRSASRHPVRSGNVGVGDQMVDLIDSMPGKIGSPEAPLEHKEHLDRLYAAMEKLPEMDRQVLLLRHYGDMPFKEIARTLDCPLGTVLARAHRALGKLRVLMEVGHETPQ